MAELRSIVINHFLYDSLQIEGLFFAKLAFNSFLVKYLKC